MASFDWLGEYTCCNPFGRTHSSREKNMRSVSVWMCEKMPSLSLGSKICNDCRLKLARLPTPPECSTACDFEPPASPECISSDESFLIGAAQSRLLVNECMDSIGETPITQRKIRSKMYLEQKMKKITTMMESAVIDVAPSKESETGVEIINPLTVRTGYIRFAIVASQFFLL